MGDREQGIDQRQERWRFLAALPLLEGFDGAELRELETEIGAVQLAAGQLLFAEEDSTDGLALVVSGSLRLVGPSGPTSTAIHLTSGASFSNCNLPIYVPAALEA